MLLLVSDCTYTTICIYPSISLSLSPSPFSLRSLLSKFMFNWFCVGVSVCMFVFLSPSPFVKWYLCVCSYLCWCLCFCLHNYLYCWKIVLRWPCGRPHHVLIYSLLVNFLVTFICKLCHHLRNRRTFSRLSLIRGMLLSSKHKPTSIGFRDNIKLLCQ